MNHASRRKSSAFLPLCSHRRHTRAKGIHWQNYTGSTTNVSPKGWNPSSTYHQKRRLLQKIIPKCPSAKTLHKLTKITKVSGFNFAAGFYAVMMDPESKLYTAFYVEGRGYLWYSNS